MDIEQRWKIRILFRRPLSELEQLVRVATTILDNLGCEEWAIHSPECIARVATRCHQECPESRVYDVLVGAFLNVLDIYVPATGHFLARDG